MTGFIPDFVATAWTPIFMAVFVAVVVYALWPAKRDGFADAARMPLRED